MLKIFPIGGISDVTKNMFLYEYGDDMLVVDCGIGFPDESMPGVEFLVPDIDYLVQRLNEGATLHGIVLTHGHDDHIAALPYVLRELPANPPIYGSRLTAEFAMTRLEDGGVEKEVQTYVDGEILQLGPFGIEPVWVTHSIPDTRHLAIHTPEGIVYHGSDFKFDPTPVDNAPSDFEHIKALGKQGILCAMVDCLRIERAKQGNSESTVIKALREEMADVQGKVIVTLMSSSIHRIQQTIDAAAEIGRKVSFVGRSVEQNVNSCMNLGLLHFPPDVKVNKRNMADIADNELCVIAAGSQGQPGSTLVRAVDGSHRFLSVNKGDKVIFSSDVIPGSERHVYGTINKIFELGGVDVAYTDLNPGLHVSGHASAEEQMELVDMLKAKYVFPIGGEARHRFLFAQAVEEHGYGIKQVVLPKEGKIVEFQGGSMRYGAQIKLRHRTVDTTGMASVVAEHLDERSLLGKGGALVVSVKLDDEAGAVLPEHVAVDTRGVTVSDEHLRERFIQVIQDLVAEQVNTLDDEAVNQPAMRKQLEKMIARTAETDLGVSPLVMVMLHSPEAAL
jgi:ribonuclease J